MWVGPPHEVDLIDRLVDTTDMSTDLCPNGVEDEGISLAINLVP